MPEFNPDKVTIKDLVVEEPEKRESGLPFDVERDITDSDWMNMDKKMADDKYLKPNRWRPQLKTWAISKLFGHRTNMEQSDWDYILPELEKDLKQYNAMEDDQKAGWFMHALEQAAYAKQLGQAVDLGIPDEVVEKGIMGKIKTEEFNPHVYLMGLANYAIITGNVVKLTKKQREGIKESFDNISRYHSNDSIACYMRTEIAVAAKILGLGKEIDFNDDDWAGVEKVISENRQYNNDATTFWEYCYYAAIIAADGVKIPEGGSLELINNKKIDLQPQTPPMPETRQF